MNLFDIFEDPSKKNAEQTQSQKCPHCGGKMVSEELINEKQDACYYKVKSRYKVWPSAYASGALVQCRKKGAANWGNKSESKLNEFAPLGSSDGGNDGFSEETLKRLAAQWWNGDEDPRVEQTLQAAGWEIGQDEGYDNGGAFVVQAGDTNGNSYISWPAEELEGVAEGAIKDLHIDLQDQQWDAIVGYVINGLKKNMDIGRIELNLYKYAGQEMFDVDQELQDRGFNDIADLADHIRQHNGRYVPPTDFNLGNGVAEGRFDEPLTGWHIVSREHGQVVRGTPSFETKDQAQEYLMTRMFANHQDFKVVHTAGVAEGAELPAEVTEMIKKIAASSATPEHKKAAIDALIAKHSQQGVAEASNDYFKRRKDEESRIAGTKAPARRTPQQTDYAKRRAQEKKSEQGVAEGTLKPEADHRSDVDRNADIEVLGVDHNAKIFKITYNGKPYTVKLDYLSQEDFDRWQIPDYDVEIINRNGKNIVDMIDWDREGTSKTDRQVQMVDTIIAYLDTENAEDLQYMAWKDEDLDNTTAEQFYNYIRNYYVNDQQKFDQAIQWLLKNMVDDQARQDLANYVKNPVSSSDLRKEAAKNNRTYTMYVAFSYSREGNTEITPGMNLPAIQLNDPDDDEEELQQKIDDLFNKVKFKFDAFENKIIELGEKFNLKDPDLGAGMNAREMFWDVPIQTMWPAEYKIASSVAKNILKFKAAVDKYVQSFSSSLTKIGLPGITEYSTWQGVLGNDLTEQQVNYFGTPEGFANIANGKIDVAKMINDNLQRKSLEEKLGDNRPALGTKRDAGKSVRKWRKERGLDEQGVAEAMPMTSLTSRYVDDPKNPAFAAKQPTGKDPLDSLSGIVALRKTDPKRAFRALQDYGFRNPNDPVIVAASKIGNQVKQDLLQKKGITDPRPWDTTDEMSALIQKSIFDYIEKNLSKTGVAEGSLKEFSPAGGEGGDNYGGDLYDILMGFISERYPDLFDHFGSDILDSTVSNMVAMGSFGDIDPSSEDDLEDAVSQILVQLEDDALGESKGELWRVLEPRNIGGHAARYYVVKGQGKDLKIWRSKSGAGDFIKQADAEDKADELNQKVDEGMTEEWSQKYKRSINCASPKGFSQKAHCAGRKKNEDVAEGKRIARKPGQPAGSKKHSDLYTDENPKGTITGLKFATAEDARASVSKIKNSGRSHAHKIQAAVAMEQRARAAGKSEAAAVYRRYINANKKTDEGLELDENLRKWFKQEWVRFGPDGKIRGDCARGDDSEGKPKCLPRAKAQSLGKKGRASAASRKRREDPNPERSGAAINVATKKKSNESVDYLMREAVSSLELAEVLMDTLVEKNPEIIKRYGHEVVGDAVMDAAEQAGNVNSKDDVDQLVNEIVEKLSNPMQDDDVYEGDEEIVSESMRLDKEIKMYYNIVGTSATDLRNKFGMHKDCRGFFLNESNSARQIMQAEQAFGRPTKIC